MHARPKQHRPLGSHHRNLYTLRKEAADSRDREFESNRHCRRGAAGYALRIHTGGVLTADTPDDAVPAAAAHDTGPATHGNS